MRKVLSVRPPPDFELELRFDTKPYLDGDTSPGSVVVVVPPGGTARWTRLSDTVAQVPDALDVV